MEWDRSTPDYEGSQSYPPEVLSFRHGLGPL